MTVFGKECIIPAVLGVLAFLLTEDLGGPMTMVGRSTMLMVLFPTLNGVLTAVTRNPREEQKAKVS